MTHDDLSRTADTSLSPQPARTTLDTFFLEARARLLDLAAILDRIDRGKDSSAIQQDPRLLRIQQALEILHDPHASRAERIQRLFSLEYDPGWKRPQPR